MRPRRTANQLFVFCVHLGRAYWRKFWREFVQVITSDKVVQAVMTGSAVAIIGKGAETLGIFSNAFLSYFLGFTFPLPPVVLATMVFFFSLAYWADKHQEEWRGWVEEKTGEKAADDEEGEKE